MCVTKFGPGRVVLLAGVVAASLSLPPSRLQAQEPSARNREIRQLLRQPTDRLRQGIDDGTPLHDALDIIGKLHGVMIQVDHAAFAKEGVMELQDNAVKLHKKRGVPLSVLLGELLSSLPTPCTYVVRDDRIVIVPACVVEEGSLLKGRIDADFDQRPLYEALQELAVQTGASIVVDSRVHDAAKTRVSASLQRVPLRTAVRLLADMAQLKTVLVDNVIYVTSPDNAKTFEREQLRPGK